MPSNSPSVLMNNRLVAWGAVVVPFRGIPGSDLCHQRRLRLVACQAAPPREFALFTAGFAAFTILNVIANGGVASVMTSQGALVVDDMSEMRGLIDVVRVWRIRLAALAAIVALPILVYSMNRLGYAPIVIGAGLALGSPYIALNILGAGMDRRPPPAWPGQASTADGSAERCRAPGCGRLSSDSIDRADCLFWRSP